MLGGARSVCAAASTLPARRGAIRLSARSRYKDGKPEPLCTGKPDGQILTTPNTADAKVRAAVAKDDTARKAAYKTLAELYNRDVPSIIYETVIERVAWQNKIHGVYMTESTMLYLDKTWIEK